MTTSANPSTWQTPVFEDGTTLLGMLREANAQGATRFVLKATFDDTSMALTYITE